MFEDVCISYSGMTMSSGRTFDIEDTSSRITKSDSRNTVQVTLIHEQVPD